MDIPQESNKHDIEIQERYPENPMGNPKKSHWNNKKNHCLINKSNMLKEIVGHSSGPTQTVVDPSNTSKIMNRIVGHNSWPTHQEYYCGSMNKTN